MIARWFWREWRSPSLLIVWLALSLAVACVLALGNISDRMEKGLSQQSREFMAGDRALRSSREVPQAWLEEAQKRGLKVGKQLTFATMTFAGDTPQLANVKAVDDIYPMYGDLQTNPPGLKPQAGSVLLAPRLMALLNLKTGDTIDVGDATLRIAGEVIQEPDSGFNPFQMAPRLMMNLADVDKTGAVQPGSRVTWRYKFGMYGPLSTISRAQMEQQFSANFFGAHQLTMRLLPAMLPHGEGRIVMTSSVMGLISTPGRGAYAASKYAPRGFPGSGLTANSAGYVQTKNRTAPEWSSTVQEPVAG
jgi:predicted lysophospholipase L1 biosynthesis ABC-type transport system permease subunit